MSRLVLSVETATRGGSLAIAKGKNILASSVGDSELSHSNTVLAEIDKLISKADLQLTDIDMFAVAIGPGSFTGLRIGIATVKGLAATLKCRCMGIPTLHAIAYAAGVSDATVALLPAGRQEVFAQLLQVAENEVVKELDVAVHIPPHALLEKYGLLARLCWAGPGAHVYLETLRALAKQVGKVVVEASDTTSGWRLAPITRNLAIHVAALASSGTERADTQTPNALCALYVRPSDAEINAGYSRDRK
jgi:tRNA threonylcarbamoyladenosine biosynthesis protein TsaB